MIVFNNLKLDNRNVYIYLYLYIFMKMLTIPKVKDERLKLLAKNVDWDVVDDFKQGLEELKKGKVIQC